MGRSLNDGKGRLLFLPATLLLGAAFAVPPSLARDGKPTTLRIEPRAPWRAFSMKRAVAYLDGAAGEWQAKKWDFNDNKTCASCHTTYAYLMARAVLPTTTSPVFAKARGYIEERVRSGARARPWYDGTHGSPQQAQASRETEAVMNAFVLSLSDRKMGMGLRPVTRQALDRMWQVRDPKGVWKWLAFGLRPWETKEDAYAGAALAALATSLAPYDYAATPLAKSGLDALRGYFRAQEGRTHSLHHRLILLWAAQHTSALLTEAAQQEILKNTLAAQNADGGWSLPTLLKTEGFTGGDGESDGYATGLAVYILRQTGLSAREKPLESGVAWLKTHQCEPGFWFTRSPDGHSHYISHMGTAFAVMALTACGVR